MSVVDEVDLVRDRVARIRDVYRDCTVVLLPDGAEAEAQAWPAARGIRTRPTAAGLYARDGRGRVVEAHLDAFLETNARWWFKIDPDTIVRRSFRALPEEPCFFGTLQGGNPAPSLQGGCVGGTREAARQLVTSGILQSPELLDPGRTWARGNPFVQARARGGRVSFDFIHAWACREVAIPLIDHPEIRSEWKLPPEDPGRYAVTHPHKTLDESAERAAGASRRLQTSRAIELIDSTVPLGARVAVVSKGDERFTRIGRWNGRHFPEDTDGKWAGFHPADSQQAISLLRAAQLNGVDHLAIPETASWWLDYYREFTLHLATNHSLVARADGAGTIWALAKDRL
jgi:hypothetical protein